MLAARIPTQSPSSRPTVVSSATNNAFIHVPRTLPGSVGRSISRKASKHALIGNQRPSRAPVASMNGSSNEVDLAIEYLSLPVSQILSDPLTPFVEACESPSLLKFSRSWGLNVTGFERNDHSKAGNVVYDRFVNSVQHLPQDTKLSIAFHGTKEEGIPDILLNGLDPAKRRRQAYGKGEYFAREPTTSYSYCKGGKKMIVFVVVEEKDSAYKRRLPPRGVLVIPKAEHQLPLGVMSFVDASAESAERSVSAREALKKLNQAVQAASLKSRIAATKANIIQLMICKDIDSAAEVYNQEKGLLPHEAKQEISMYAHRLFPEYVKFSFDDMPPPITAAEFDAMIIDSVDLLELAVLRLRKTYEAEQLRVSSMYQPATATPQAP